MPIDADGFRQIFASLPTTVAVVTTIDGAGTPRGLTTNTVTAVSKEPPLLLVCLDEGSQTLRAVRESGVFVVNFLADSERELSQVFAGKGQDKFGRVRHVPSAAAGGAPVLAAHAIAHAECVVQREIGVGDHTILIGRLEAGAVHDRVPLMYHRRAYSSWPTVDRLSVPTA
ncbi:NADH-FMN oxidoreductase RutF, flavin reductase (DIM6/NTAB) family [Streptoalloteichus tenebrarius]|uniref:NADH-FMN oxidoreductase RutF, flavin reductase (DIM6/NTAB) family n=1 Tax=Streptoalloteichus tenebrarius (strain ATCC 17920 / DSM 40477 / JCM 4838 / CBS 697.72 / NBRC 16177 / NCIMB 11028 / NRRL B-12390 / A12253. 1 / ISP 5477) TaxID=1933 RepID=A0ABT1HXL0_STRSD|nr:flavin reductase family protein [Streptoalloteichus tenebrarius]MCP2260263.1 NADH-FMN oxidoreductase RutF, flavin reductase (DIM6/NTAB) family [Streptoalloteichus tenebrarius]BFF03013.1 hypothetical protein GCM10020241_46880 [Streptoalloteichus tenebrarius]